MTPSYIDPIAQLLAGRYPDPETGEPLAADVRSLVIESSLAGREADLVAALGTGPRVTVISDRNTHPVLGARVERALDRFAIQSIVLDAPRADESTVTRVLDGLAPTDLVIAVGSGTLNDISKLVALRHGCPQAVFATAPSMNGYTSLSASITQNGIKTSVRARTPIGVFFDLEIIAAAPTRLIRSGLGDSAGRPTAQADWLLQHLLLDRPYREAPFAMLVADERELFANTAALVAGDLEAVRHLVRILVLSGFGMTLCDGSYPASQGEHLISHYIEMLHPPGLPHSFHGEQVGVAAVAMAALQRRILDGKRPTVHSPRVTRDDLVAHFGPEIGEGCWVDFQHKLVDPDLLNARLADWDHIRERIAATALPDLRGPLSAAGAPVEPAELGWSDALFGEAMRHAREIRNRYTFLDLALDSDQL